MSDPNISPWHACVQEALKKAIRSIRDALNPRAVVIVVIHADGKAQAAACVSPMAEQLVAAELRRMGEKIATTPPNAIEMREPFKN